MAKGSAKRKAAKSVRGARRTVGRAQRRERAEEGGSEKPTYREQIKAKQVDQANKRPGCAPKLFMLLLPFAAAGTFLFLRS